MGWLKGAMSLNQKHYANPWKICASSDLRFCVFFPGCAKKSPKQKKGKNRFEHFMLKLQRMRTSKFVAGLGKLFGNWLTKRFIWPHACQDACCKEGYPKEI